MSHYDPLPVAMRAINEHIQIHVYEDEDTRTYFWQLNLRYNEQWEYESVVAHQRGHHTIKMALDHGIEHTNRIMGLSPNHPESETDAQ